MKFNKTILVIGFGSIGKRHTNNILKITDSDVIIFTHRTDIDMNEFFHYTSNKHRIQISNNFTDCLKKSPSVAFITNETNLHIKYAIKLSQAKINLFIEKPLSYSMKNISHLESIVRKNKIKVMIGSNFRFYPPIKKIKNLVKNKLVGKIISIQCENSSYLPDWHPYEDYSQGYASKKELGGGVTLTQIHELDYLLWIFGNVKSFQSLVGKFSELKVNTDDLCTCFLQLKNKIIVELHLDYFSKPYYRRLKIRGSKGTIYWNSDENKVKFYDIRKNSWSEIPVKHNYRLTSSKVNQMYIDEISYFFNCIMNNKKPMNDISEAKITLKQALQLKK